MGDVTTKPTHTAGRVARWMGGTLATVALYLVRRVPVYRRDRLHSEWDPPAPDRSLPGDPSSLQRLEDGVGRVLHRRYWIDVTDTALTPESLIEMVSGDINRFVPAGISEATGLDGSDLRRLDVGDELVIRIAGPWDGPVRVIGRTPTSFRFATLRGHLEAGEIEFRAGWEERGFLRFEIESWARSGDHLFELLYDKLPFARETQLYMWAVFCRRVARQTKGVVMGSVQAETERRDPS